MAEQIKSDGAQALALTGHQREEAVRALRAFPTEAIRTAAHAAFEILPDPVSQRDVAEALSILRGDAPLTSLKKARHTPLAEAARFWMRHHPEGRAAPRLETVLKDYLEAKKHRRPTTVYEIQHKIKRFCQSFPDTSVAEITTDDIDSWLSAHTTSLANRRKYHRLLHAYFEYAKRKWRLESNPTDNVFIDRGDLDEVLPEAYSVDEVKRLLKAASTDIDAHTVVPVLAVGLFAGLRPSEAQHLTWEDVDFEEHHIRVRPETAKRRRQRFVEMSENLRAWLTPHLKTSRPLSPPSITYRRARKRILAAAEVEHWLRDGLRHTYATYHLAYHEDPGKTAFEMGHRGNADLVFAHYRKLAKKSDAARFWQIMPEKTTG